MATTPERRAALGAVVLADGVAEHIAADLREFIDATQWYVDRGIRTGGYLLHGAKKLRQVVVRRGARRRPRITTSAC